MSSPPSSLGKSAGLHPSDEALKAYLVRRQFAQSAINDVIKNYRETIELVTRESPEYDSSAPEEENETENQPVTATTAPTTEAQAHPSPPPTGAPFHFAVVGDSIELSGRLTSPDQVERVVKLLELNKVMIAPVDQAFDTGDDDPDSGWDKDLEEASD